MLRFKQFLQESMAVGVRVPRVGETVRYAGKEALVAWVFDQIKGGITSEPYYEVGLAFKDDKNFPQMQEFIKNYVNGLNRSKSPWFDFARKFGTFSVPSNDLDYSDKVSQSSQNYMPQSSQDQVTNKNFK